MYLGDRANKWMELRFNSGHSDTHSLGCYHFNTVTCLVNAIKLDFANDEFKCYTDKLGENLSNQQ